MIYGLLNPNAIAALSEGAAVLLFAC